MVLVHAVDVQIFMVQQRFLPTNGKHAYVFILEINVFDDIAAMPPLAGPMGIAPVMILGRLLQTLSRPSECTGYNIGITDHNGQRLH